MVEAFGKESDPYPQVPSVPVAMKLNIRFIRPPDALEERRELAHFATKHSLKALRFDFSSCF